MYRLLCMTNKASRSQNFERDRVKHQTSSLCLCHGTCLRIPNKILIIKLLITVLAVVLLVPVDEWYNFCIIHDSCPWRHGMSRGIIDGNQFKLHVSNVNITPPKIRKVRKSGNLKFHQQNCFTFINKTKLNLLLLVLLLYEKTVALHHQLSNTTNTQPCFILTAVKMRRHLLVSNNKYLLHKPRNSVLQFSLIRLKFSFKICV